MTELETATLEGEPLAWAVGMALGLDLELAPPVYGNQWRVFAKYFFTATERTVRYNPHEDWALGGPVSEAEVLFTGPAAWDAEGVCVLRRAQPAGSDVCFVHANQLVASMRAVVYARLGETVLVPKELC
ncbi:DUF2591 domain-containing protein [Pseudomonas mosselii]|nr:DUF2591 domain-containing protein [Pseudomonas mosselii]MCU9535553.1 DUF2591 domain-containing protein [Pseudomonas mosselii]MCU9547403.1 DUF2591 domain-containing protein [Pseudomonas mosselii]